MMGRTYFDIVESKEDVSNLRRQYYGHSAYTISEEEIQALREGKFLIADDGEYSLSIEMEKKESEA